jgi:hypothetical protein
MSSISPSRVFAAAIGVFFVVVGAAGLIPAALWPPVAGRTDQVFHWLDGRLFNVIHINGIESVWHIVLGLLGIAMAFRQRSARIYDEALAIVFFCLVLTGLAPPAQTLAGIAPMHGHDLVLYFIIALLAAVFGFVIPVSRKALKEESQLRTAL